MNVEIGTEAPQFPEKEYINGIFVAVWLRSHLLGFITSPLTYHNLLDVVLVYSVTFEITHPILKMTNNFKKDCLNFITYCIPPPKKK